MEKAQRPTGWKFHHIGVEGDDVSYQGIRLWDHSAEWENLHMKIIAPHPSYPKQVHHLSAVKLRNIKFAVGEVSNGVWLFYVPS